MYFRGDCKNPFCYTTVIPAKAGIHKLTTFRLLQFHLCDFLISINMLHIIAIRLIIKTITDLELIHMATFELVSMRDAQLELTLTGKRGAILKNYIDYLEQRDPDQAGKLTADSEETTAAIRRRLAAAAELTGRELVITRQDDVVYFWDKGDGPEPKRRGRRPKSAM